MRKPEDADEMDDYHVAVGVALACWMGCMAYALWVVYELMRG